MPTGTCAGTADEWEERESVSRKAGIADVWVSTGRALLCPIYQTEGLPTTSWFTVWTMETCKFKKESERIPNSLKFGYISKKLPSKAIWNALFGNLHTNILMRYGIHRGERPMRSLGMSTCVKCVCSASASSQLKQVISIYPYCKYDWLSRF